MCGTCVGVGWLAGWLVVRGVSKHHPAANVQRGAQSGAARKKLRGSACTGEVERWGESNEGVSGGLLGVCCLLWHVCA